MQGTRAEERGAGDGDDAVRRRAAVDWIDETRLGFDAAGGRSCAWLPLPSDPSKQSQLQSKSFAVEVDVTQPAFKSERGGGKRYSCPRFTQHTST